MPQVLENSHNLSAQPCFLTLPGQRGIVGPGTTPETRFQLVLLCSERLNSKGSHSSYQHEKFTHTTTTGCNLRGTGSARTQPRHRGKHRGSPRGVRPAHRVLGRGSHVVLGDRGAPRKPSIPSPPGSTLSPPYNKSRKT